MSNFPYSVFCLFKNSPRQAVFVGTSSWPLSEADLFGVDPNATFPPEKPNELWLRRPSVQSLPHLPFILADEIVPSCAPFEILQPIAVEKRDHPIGHSGRGQACYGLSKEKCAGWIALEKNLRALADSLMYFAKHYNGVQFVKSFKPFHNGYLPSAWKYNTLFNTEHEALEVLHHALAGYQLLMALVSYAIVLCHIKDDNSRHPRWASYLQDDRKFNPCLVDTIKSSPLNSLTCRRVGAETLQRTT